MPDTVYESMQAEIARLRHWVDDLQSGMFVNCVYCGHRYGPKDEVPATMALALMQHIAQCPKHPMSTFVRLCRLTREMLTASGKGHLCSHLRAELAREIDRALEAIEEVHREGAKSANGE